MIESSEASVEDGGWLCRVRVPLDHPAFEGHFPGEPVLPGIAQLDLALQALARCEGRERRVAAIRTLRLRRVVHPGDRLELRLRRPDASGAFGFELLRDGEVASSGTVLLAPSLE